MQKCRSFIFKLIEHYEHRIVSVRQILDQAEKWVIQDETAGVLSNNDISAQFLEDRIQEIIGSNINNEFENTIAMYLNEISLLKTTNEENLNIINSLQIQSQSLKSELDAKCDIIESQLSELTFLNSRQQQDNQSYEAKLNDNSDALMEKEVEFLKTVRSLKIELSQKQDEVSTLEKNFAQVKASHDSLIDEKNSWQVVYEKFKSNERNLGQEFETLNQDL